MNITPELAAKVLDADLRNIVKKVSDGGILSPSERQMLQNAAFPESQAKAKRAVALALKYSSGSRLTASELAEVREMHPGFAPEAAPAPEPTPDDGRPPLDLSAEPAPSKGDGELTKQQLDKWGAMYGVEHRQLRRWIDRGREKKDPCPLDDPTAMPRWVEKNLDKVRSKVRDAVASAAAAAKKPAPAPTPEPCTATGGSQPAEPPPPAAQSPRIEGIDLSQVGGVEGESVGIFQRQFNATALSLEEAYKGDKATGNVDDDRINVLTRRLEKVGESLRKHQIAAEARARRNGDILSKTEVITGITQAVALLKRMRKQRKKMLRSAMSELPPDVLEKLDAAIDHISESEESVFATIRTLPSIDDALRLDN